jgi:hypothetical protein
MKRLVAVVVGVVLATGLVTVGGTETAQASTSVTTRVRAAVKQLPVAAETPTGYSRSNYRLWVDGNGDCQDTRAEVLVAETKSRTTGGCTIRTGRWFSYYDKHTWTHASDVDIDHLVALKESWDSGAKQWNSDTRTRYANDLGDARSLVAVTDNVNQSKSDRDPAEWMPTYGKCLYVKQWTAVKIRWGLKVDKAEKAKLSRVAASCPNDILKVTKARIVKSSGTASGGAGGAGSGGGLDPRFSYCYHAKDAGYGPYYRGTDAEYAWYSDNDHDGIVCE